MVRFDVDELKENMNQTAAGFSKALEDLAGFFEDRFGQVVRKTTLDLFANIVKRSPVDTGTYRASHGIANHEPEGEEGVIKISKEKKDPSGATKMAMDKARAWYWYPGAGTIYIFNNVPYAEPLEVGHSGQAPQGVYRQALTEVEAIMNKQIIALRVGRFFK